MASRTPEQPKSEANGDDGNDRLHPFDSLDGAGRSKSRKQASLFGDERRQIKDGGDNGDHGRASRLPKEKDERDDAQREAHKEQAENRKAETGHLGWISCLETGRGSEENIADDVRSESDCEDSRRVRAFHTA